MFNMGMPELILIGAAALLIFGPRKLPELAKGLGKGIRDFKKALDGEQLERENHSIGNGEQGKKTEPQIATTEEKKELSVPSPNYVKTSDKIEQKVIVKNPEVLS